MAASICIKSRNRYAWTILFNIICNYNLIMETILITIYFNIPRLVKNTMSTMCSCISIAKIQDGGHQKQIRISLFFNNLFTCVMTIIGLLLKYKIYLFMINTLSSIFSLLCPWTKSKMAAIIYQTNQDIFRSEPFINVYV